MRKSIEKAAIVAACCVLSGLPASAQQDGSVPTKTPEAAQAKPTMGERAGQLVAKVTGDPLADADVDMRRVLAAHADLGPKPIEKLSPQEARQQPTVADAVKVLLQKEGKDPAALNAKLGVKTQDAAYDTGGGAQPLRIYMPSTAVQGAKLPIVVYYHGGGWVIADINVYDSTPRAMAEKTNAIFVSVEYRLAPENKFPAAHDDAIAAYKWVLANADTFGGDPARVAVMGESAGGNLAINTAIAARDQKLQAPLHQILVYPVAGVSTDTPSYREYEKAKPLNKAMIGWFVGHLTKGEQDLQDGRLDIVGKANLAGLPAATIINAQIDPLASDGQQLSDMLSKAGVAVRHQVYDGVAHEFFGMNAVVAKAEAAQAFAAEQLTMAFEKARPASN